MYCKYCGKKIKDESMFCQYCGKNVEHKTLEMIEKNKEICAKKDNVQPTRKSKVVIIAICIILIIVIVAWGIAFIIPQTLHGSRTVNIKQANVGDYVNFGKYVQNEDGDNKTDIEWVVVSKKKNSLLLVSRYILDAKPYHDDIYLDYSKESDDLRIWMLGTFYKKSFSKEEKKMIKKEQYVSCKGKDYKDKVFLLSVEQYKRYFNSDEERICELTPYVKNKIGKEYLDYWARYSEQFDSFTQLAPCIKSDGTINKTGMSISVISLGVRPAIWVEIDN